ncbi:hypothetical protein Tco_0052774 [Tanacetum coccineum]
MLRGIQCKDHLCKNPTGFAFGKPASRLTLSPKILTYGKSSKMAILFSKTKDKPYELLEDGEKKQLGKNNEAKMTLYNALPRKMYETVFLCKTIKEVLRIKNEAIMGIFGFD